MDKDIYHSHLQKKKGNKLTTQQQENDKMQNGAF